MNTSFPCSCLFWLLALLLLENATALTHLYRPFNNTISAVLIFGDSTVDSGNNNYITSVTKCNFPPYGIDFDENHTPTGRFSDGRLVTDYMASYIGVKEYVPPYLDSTLTTDELMTGVTFASGGSGYDPLTHQISRSISLDTQLEYFREYKKKLESEIGEEKTKSIVSNAAFLISAGTNDMVINYYATPFRRRSYTVAEYHQYLLQLTQEFIQDLIKEGAKVIGVVGMPPIGCLPAVITLFSGTDLISSRQCLDSYSAAARDYNHMLQEKLKALETPSTKIIFADIYKPLEDMIQNPTKYGFEEVDTGCCGSGYIEVSYLCNRKSSVCANASKYIFFDSVHPTQATYYNLFQTLRPIIDLTMKKY
ncbi:GDSL esterase/lipase At5g45960-like [Ipomoea triloba]|uniref:GDSL esterase/lipase At5g45960-like n=1 Tax=Ipomoea triloba TaxID=35885 RepID=UPI00125D9791|nr:GDSL esterase/lipase At5g45960-like [Ipomoea triloba]